MRMHAALSALEKEAGIIYDDSKLHQGAKLMQACGSPPARNRHPDHLLQLSLLSPVHLALYCFSSPCFASHPVLLPPSTMQLVWGEMEAVLAADVDEAAAERRAEEEALLRGGRGDYASQVAACVEGAHPSSITCIRPGPRGDVAITGSGGCVLQQPAASACLISPLRASGRAFSAYFHVCGTVFMYVLHQQVFRFLTSC